MSGSRRRFWAVVPMKPLACAKSRLAAALGDDRREALALAMFHDVLQTLCGCTWLGGVMVITRDPRIAAIARARGALVGTEAALHGYNAAVRGAAECLSQQNRAMLVVPGDVPLIDGADVAELLDGLPAGPAMVLAPARDRRGTNALACDPASLVQPRFGLDSFNAHRSAGEAAGVTPVIRCNPRFALDIDNPADIDRLLSGAATTRAQALAGSWPRVTAAPPVAVRVHA